MTAAARRALVTGATGFIGSHLIQHLKAGGWRVAVLARPTAATLLTANSTVESVYVYSGKIEEVIAAVAEFHPNVVFHVGSLFLPSHDSAQVEALISSNILFGTRILEAMKLAKVTSLINTGTSWQNSSGNSYDPVNLYAATKQAFEDILSYYTRAAGIDALTLRLFDSYGPGDKRRKILRLLLQCLRTGEPLAMSPGEQVLDLVHVDDICRAFLCAAELLPENPATRVYSVSGGQRRTLRQVVATLEEAAGRKIPVHFGAVPYREREVMNPWVGPPLPGWRPQVDLLTGFRMLLASESDQIEPTGGTHSHGV